MTDPVDLAVLTARFTRLLKDEGIIFAPERASDFLRAVDLIEPALIGELYWCARVTLVSRYEELERFDEIFSFVFGNTASRSLFEDEGGLGVEPRLGRRQQSLETSLKERFQNSGSFSPMDLGSLDGVFSGESLLPKPFPTLGSESETLSSRNFAELSAREVYELAPLMSQIAMSMPKRLSGRSHPVFSEGVSVDLRASFRRARRTGGDLAELVHRKNKVKNRRLVVLLDISGSMEPYTLPYLQFLHCASKVVCLEAFTFATRLTRVSSDLKNSNVDIALNSAGQNAPDWSSGTLIGDALESFIDIYGRRGFARGAVVVVVSDGWEFGDVSVLRVQMERLSRLAFRIVWVNPRKANEGYLPVARGMAAALPYCSAFVSGHSILALKAVVDAFSE